MEIKKGIGVSPGVVICRAFVLDTEEFPIPERHVDAAAAKGELERLRQAVVDSKRDVVLLRDRMADQIGDETAAIFDFHLRMLDDKVMLRRVRDVVRDQGVTAEHAVATVFRDYAKEYLNMPQFWAERVKDVHDIQKRLLRNLIGQSRATLDHLDRDVALLAHDLTPSQTASLDRSHVLGLATDAGGRTSHTAIVAHALGIPAVVGLKDVTLSVQPGQTVIIDGNRGVVVIDPDEATIAEHRHYVRRLAEMERQLVALRDLPAVTRDGHEITLMGNIEFPQEAATVLEKGGAGIGLYRTEYLYLGSESEPTEQQHYDAYCQAIALAAGRPVVIRTLDLGADKYTQDRALVPERNPMLGLRSIRYCLRNIPLFKTQIRAVLRAALTGPVSLLFPLITNLMELRQAKMIVRDVIEDLEEEGVEFMADVPIGMMVEVPSAALMCDAFAREVDFFSIGTNDLVQYTLAVDRGNERVASLYTAAHPAVLRLIKDVVRAGQRHDVSVSLCGEIASDPEFTLLLLGLGLRVFSIAPPAIPEIKRIIRSVTLEQAMLIARKAMTFDSDKQVTSYLRDQTRRLVPDAF
jgi:phosphotransferase system enzyme I (PtsI)